MGMYEEKGEVGTEAGEIGGREAKRSYSMKEIANLNSDTNAMRKE